MKHSFRIVLSFLLIGVLCLGLLPQSTAKVSASTEVTIHTPEDLLAVKDNPSGTYILADDLDMSGIDWEPFAFSGFFYGNGHTLYNLKITKPGTEKRDTVDGNDKVYPTVFAGLFSALDQKALVTELKLQGLDINITTDEHCYIGSIAGYMNDATISKCTVLDARLTLTTGGKMTGVGGLVGFGYGTIEGCETDTVLTYTDTNEKDKCEEFLAGVLACGNAWIRDCQINIEGFCSVTGYVHNGGLVGMFYQYDKESEIGTIENCHVNGAIHFFENNEDRRAYCEAYVGEPLTDVYPENCSNDFETDERDDYETILLPEECKSPSYTASIVEPTCTAWGYTTYLCSDCDYSYRADFTAPGHVKGEWETVLEPTEDAPGRNELKCTVCGEILETEEIAQHVSGEWEQITVADYNVEGLRQRVCVDCGLILESITEPALIPVEVCQMLDTELNLNYKDIYAMKVSVLPIDATNNKLHWNSSNTEVATVSDTGLITATGRGTTTISCYTDDGYASSTCLVTVDYTFGQWLIKTILFGWLWY